MSSAKTLIETLLDEAHGPSSLATDLGLVGFMPVAGGLQRHVTGPEVVATVIATVDSDDEEPDVGSDAINLSVRFQDGSQSLEVIYDGSFTALQAKDIVNALASRIRNLTGVQDVVNVLARSGTVPEGSIAEVDSADKLVALARELKPAGQTVESRPN